ncbi:MAG: SIMPL domain-containing protein [Cytophagales bacterium]|nr:SIMPL domain-containing protein [Cytophagales bacterium]
MRTVIFLTLISFFAVPCFSQQLFKNFIDENYIEVTGKAEMEITPNEIYLKIIISEKDNKGKQTLEELEKLMIGKLKSLDVDIEKNLTVHDISSNFKDYWLGKTDIFTTKEYQVLVNDASTAGKIFRELESVNISNISVDRLSHSELEKFRQQVKIEAIKTAKAKAESLATAIDQTIGKAIHIQEIDDLRTLQGKVPEVSNIVIRGNSSLYGSRAPEPEIEFGEINLEYRILAKFKLE